MMKSENLVTALVGGIVAGAAFGAGFAIAGKGIAKLGKKEKVDQPTTKPMEIAAEGYSSLVGEGLVNPDSWSNAWGNAGQRIQKSQGGYCQKGGMVSTISASDCKEAGGQFVKY